MKCDIAESVQLYKDNGVCFVGLFPTLRRATASNVREFLGVASAGAHPLSIHKFEDSGIKWPHGHWPAYDHQKTQRLGSAEKERIKWRMNTLSNQSVTWR